MTVEHALPCWKCHPRSLERAILRGNVLLSFLSFLFLPQTALPGRTSPIRLAFWDGAEQRPGSLCAFLRSISYFLELRLEN